MARDCRGSRNKTLETKLRLKKRTDKINLKKAMGQLIIFQIRDVKLQVAPKELKIERYPHSTNRSLLWSSCF